MNPVVFEKHHLKFTDVYIPRLDINWRDLVADEHLTIAIDRGEHLRYPFDLHSHILPPLEDVEYLFWRTMYIVCEFNLQ